MKKKLRLWHSSQDNLLNDEVLDGILPIGDLLNDGSTGWLD